MASLFVFVFFNEREEFWDFFTLCNTPFVAFTSKLLLWIIYDSAIIYLQVQWK